MVAFLHNFHQQLVILNIDICMKLGTLVNKTTSIEAPQAERIHQSW
jgi:hypothetical protein